MTVTGPVVFRGTETETVDLLHALNANCTCSKPMGVVLALCNLHKALISDQRWLDDMLSSRRRRADLWREEQCRPKEVE